MDDKDNVIEVNFPKIECEVILEDKEFFIGVVYQDDKEISFEADEYVLIVKDDDGGYSFSYSCGNDSNKDLKKFIHEALE